MIDQNCAYVPIGAVDPQGEVGQRGQRVYFASGASSGGGASKPHPDDKGAHHEPPKRNGGYLFFKRFFDIFLSLIAIVLLAIPMGIIAIVVKTDSKGPVLFKQKRVGKHQEPFYCLKFRSMITEAPKDCPPYMFENPDAFITKSGRFLRKSSLDELPQLFNILKGEMTIVGPRPCTPKEVDLIRLREKNGIFEMTPGLTGWAQVNGRDEISLKGKVKRDREYVEKASFGFDLKIFWLTIIKVIKREGVHEGQNEKNVIR